MTYQSFDGTEGDSDSAAKLKCLRLPEDLTGRAVLDIGCNEGFFCMEAWRRGAARVMGIDGNPEFIERARQRDPSTDYRVMDFHSLDGIDEDFDVILLLSALHYATHPQKLLGEIVGLLRPKGLFVLECGIVPERKADWVAVYRPIGDVVRHPTHAALMKALKGATARRAGTSVDQKGDPIPRYVYHANPLKPMVLLVSGPSGSGKSTLLKTVTSRGGVTPMNLDYLLFTMSSWCRDQTLLDLRTSESFGTDQLRRLVHLLTEHGVEEAFVDEVFANHRVLAPNADPPLTVIEGYALSHGNFRAAFTARLEELGCYVWNVEPAAAADRSDDIPFNGAPAGAPSAVDRL
jgi:2-polyprenyl-3-methyl-5-hydroxy-6-metoxy-1,4-benzoquinol methylase